MSVRGKKPALCGVCPGGCAVEVTLEDGRIVEVEARKDHPFGALCVRGKAAPEIVYSPDRLRTPLIRTGERGQGEFRQASWEEALDFTVARMQEIKAKYGAQAFISHSGRGTFEQSYNDFCSGRDAAVSELLLPFGSPNIASCGSLCFVSYGILAPKTTLGIMGPDLAPDLENSKLIVIWGANPITDSPPLMNKRIMKAKSQGTRIIAIDHMQSDIARKADQWVPVRSGTDGALALVILRVIINEGIYNQDFVRNWTVGFEELKTYVQQFTPEEVERITGVSQETVISLAREIATTKHVSLRTYTGLEYTNSGVQNIRAVYLIWALTGNLDVPGGLYINPPVKSTMEKMEVKKPEGILPIGAQEYPLFYELTGNAQYLELPKVVREGKPYPIKGLLINGASTLTSYPQPEIFEEAYKQLEFIVVIDRFMSKDALFADVIFPATTYYETTSYQRYPGYVALREQVIKPVGEARGDLAILAELAKRLGYGYLYPQSDEELLERAFAKTPELLAELKKHPEGVKLPTAERRYKKYELGLLRKDGKPGFETPSGKVEISSSILAKYGYEALPVYVDPQEGPLQDPELLSEFPLILNTGARIQSTFRSQHLNIPGLLKLQDKPQVLINPQDADKRGISDGDRVSIRTKRGQVCFYAAVTDQVLPGSVEVNVGGGGPIQVEVWREANTNCLTDLYNRDPISGFPVFKALLCQIEKVLQ